MEKHALSFLEEFKKMVVERVNNSPECAPDEYETNPSKWYDCVYNICLDIMNQSIEASNSYIPPNEPQIDENHPVYINWVETIKEFMNQLKGPYHININRPRNASNTLINLYNSI